MGMSIFWISLIVFVACVFNIAETCQQCGYGGQCCDDDETCDARGICQKILSDESDCGFDTCSSTSKCCGDFVCCPDDGSCCGSFCCGSDEYCNAYTMCETESIFTGYGWIFYFIIAVPVVAICAGVCGWLRYKHRLNYVRQQVHTQRRQTPATWTNDFVADRIAAAASITHPYPGNTTSNDRIQSSTSSDRRNTSSVPEISDRTYSSTRSAISDRNTRPLTMPSSPLSSPSAPLLSSPPTRLTSPSAPMKSSSTPPPSYGSISHATSIQPPSYDDVISGTVPSYSNTHIGESSQTANSFSNSGGFSNGAYV